MVSQYYLYKLKTVNNKKMESSKILELIKRQSRTINEATNNMENTPYWNKLKYNISVYLHKNEITEISVNDATTIFGLNKEDMHKILIALNKEFFERKNATC